MSQNRLEERDAACRRRLRVNLNAEMEIHQLHRKLTHSDEPGAEAFGNPDIQVELMESWSGSIAAPPAPYRISDRHSVPSFR